MTTLDRFREGFDLASGYLDWAAFGPLSRAVREEAAADLELLGTGRRAGIELVASHEQEAGRFLADLLGTAPSAVTLQPSTTQGLMQAVFGVTGGIVLSRAEFPSLPVAVTRAEENLHVIEPQWVDPPAGYMTPEVVAQALTPSTRAVAVSLVDFRTGYRADLGAIRDVIGDRLLIVDAIQGFGVVEADYAAADVVCGHGYKWLRSGRGAAFASFSERALEHLTPVFSGRTGTDLLLPLDEVPPMADDARAYTVSPVDPMAVARLAAGLDDVARVGVAAIEAAVAERTEEIIAAADRHDIPLVTPRDASRRAGIVTLRPVAADVAGLGAALANAGVTCTIRSGMVRLAAHAGTDADTIGLLSDAFAAHAQTRTW